MNAGALYLNGIFLSAVHKQQLINPATGDMCHEVAVAGMAETEAALAAARTAFDTGPWRALALSERRAYLERIAQGIRAHAGELAQLETLNTGKPLKESTFMDIPSAAYAFEYIARNSFPKKRLRRIKTHGRPFFASRAVWRS
jgi:acyl-CoA reductase-like NAD-dependent aldehyde dehydrogenase